MAVLAHHDRILERSPIFYGWVIWIVAALGIIASAPGQAFTVSLFMDSYIEAFYPSAQIGTGTITTLFGADAVSAGATFGRTAVSGLFGLGTFIAALSLTWVGRRIDRYGNHRAGVVIIALFSMVLVLISTITGPLTLLVSFIAIRLLGQGSMFLVSSTAIAQWWRWRRGWMMGLALVGFALFQSIYIPMLQRIIDAYGWRATWVMLGVSLGLVMLPLWWLLMRDQPEKYGLIPDGGNGAARVTDVPEQNWTLAEARRTRVFWVFLAGRMFTVAWGTGLVLHQVSIITGLGHAKIAVGQTFGMIALVNALVTFGLGRFISRLRPGYVLATQMTGMIATLFLAAIMRDAWLLKMFAVTFGAIMAIGASFEGTVWADLFGRKYLGAIRGFATTCLVIGSSIGPLLFGLTHDLSGSYTPILVLGIFVAMIPLVLSLLSSAPIKQS